MWHLLSHHRTERENVSKPLHIVKVLCPTAMIECTTKPLNRAIICSRHSGAADNFLLCGTLCSTGYQWIKLYITGWNQWIYCGGLIIFCHTVVECKYLTTVLRCSLRYLYVYLNISILGLFIPPFHYNPGGNLFILFHYIYLIYLFESLGFQPFLPCESL